MEQDLLVGTDEIVTTWIGSLADDLNGPTRSEDVVEGYGALASFVVGHCMECGDDHTAYDGHFGQNDTDARDRMLARVAAATRRAGLTIAETVDDIAGLGPVVMRWLADHPATSEGEAKLLRFTARFASALDDTNRRLVRILESSAIRSEREHARALSAMTEMLSHELRNRLGAAKTASQILLSSNIELDEDGLARAARLVGSSVDAALKTVADVRAVAAGGSDLRGPPRRTMPLTNLVRAVIDDLRPGASAEGVTIEVEGTLPACPVDAARMRLIVFNLVGNGVKYRDPARERSLVTLRCEAIGEGRYRLTVADNGVGIASDEIEDIFLYRVRGSAGHAQAGSGLGLAIVEEAVYQIGGSLRVSSEPGEGSTFTLEFEPIEDGEPDE